MENPKHYIDKYSDGLPEGLSQVFEQIPSVRVFERDRIIYRQGEDAQCFYYLKKGRVRIFITSENGAEKTLSTISRGAILGEAAFFDGQPRVSSAKAVIRCELVPINKQMLTDIIKSSPETAMELFRLQAQTIRMLSAQVDSMTFTDARCRIASFLLGSVQTTGERRIKTTHEEIASVVGVSRVTVSKIVTKLAGEGIIRTGYGSIIAQDIQKLEDICK